MPDSITSEERALLLEGRAGAIEARLYRAGLPDPEGFARKRLLDAMARRWLVRLQSVDGDPNDAAGDVRCLYGLTDVGAGALDVMAGPARLDRDELQHRSPA